MCICIDTKDKIVVLIPIEHKKRVCRSPIEHDTLIFSSATIYSKKFPMVPMYLQQAGELQYVG